VHLRALCGSQNKRPFLPFASPYPAPLPALCISLSGTIPALCISLSGTPSCLVHLPIRHHSCLLHLSIRHPFLPFASPYPAPLPAFCISLSGTIPALCISLSGTLHASTCFTENIVRAYYKRPAILCYSGKQSQVIVGSVQHTQSCTVLTIWKGGLRNDSLNSVQDRQLSDQPKVLPAVLVTRRDMSVR
jgi:hypothetical protein